MAELDRPSDQLDGWSSWINSGWPSWTSQFGGWPSLIDNTTAELDRQHDRRAGSNTRPARRMAELDQTRDQLGHPQSWTSPVRRMAELDQSSSADGQVGPNTRPARPSAKLERSCCLHPVLAASPLGIRTNLLLFHLDRSHRWNFTI